MKLLLKNKKVDVNEKDQDGIKSGLVWSSSGCGASQQTFKIREYLSVKDSPRMGKIEALPNPVPSERIEV